MSGLGDPVFARQLRRHVVNWAKQVVATQTIRRERRVVVAIQDPVVEGKGGTATLADGLGRVSYGTRWGGRRPAVGQTVVVDIPPAGGTRWILAIDDEAPVAATLDLETLNALGVATDKELKAHSNGGRHVETFKTHNTKAANAGNWTMLASGSITSRYGEIAGWFEINGNGATTAIGTHGRVWFRVKQQAAYGNDPVAVMKLYDAGDIAAADLVLVVTSNAGPTTYAIFAKLTRANEYLVWTPSPLEPYLVDHTWTGCSPFMAALPAGTQFVAS